MKTLPTLLAAHLRGESTTTALCWQIEKRDGSLIRGTECDKDIVLVESEPGDQYAGTYLAGSNISGSKVKSSSDMSPDNMEVTGAISNEQDVDITVYDVESGLLNRAPVTILLTNWARPQDGYYIVRYGYLGEIRRDSDKRYSTEIRGLAQLLSQQFMMTYGETCQVKRFGDSECKLNLSPLTFTGTVTSATSRKRFNATISTGSPTPDLGYFRGGELEFTTGSNSGFMREVKRDDNDDLFGHISVWDQFPSEIQVGDQFTIKPGCDRALETCIRFGNVVNFRGYGVYVTGIDELAKGPLVNDTTFAELYEQIQFP